MTEPATLAPVIAHRGASGYAPENTLSAFTRAAKSGAKCVELDASISSDGVVYVHHDDTLERCTNGHGYLCALSSTELDQLVASAGKAGYESEPLPRLSTVMELLISANLGLNLEIKPTPGLEEPTTLAICDLVREYWKSGLPLVLSSFSKEALAIARDVLPGAPRALLVCAIPHDWKQQVQTLQCRNIHCAGELITTEQASSIKGAGVGLYCYTVNTVPEMERLLSMGVDGIFTDYPSQMLGALS